MNRQKRKAQKRCLNCGKYCPDDKGLDGLPLPSGTFPYAGVCTKTKRAGGAYFKDIASRIS